MLLIIDVHVLGWMDTSKSQVKVLYAARTLVDSVAEGQTRLDTLRTNLAREHPNLDFIRELKDPIVDGHKLDMWYITVKRHIELHICGP